MTGGAELRAYVLALIVASFAGSGAVAAADENDPAPIPFVVGLTSVYAVAEERGDYESLHTVVSIGKDGYRLKASAEWPDSDGKSVSALRIVTTEDQAGARRVRSWFSQIDPEIFPGTVPGFSAAMLRELADEGETQMTYLQIESGFIKNHVHRELSGILHRVGGGAEILPVLVNGHEEQLPVIHAKGSLSDAEDAVETEVYVLDDPANPLVLRSSGIDGTLSVIRIEYPVAEQADDSIERQLANGGTVEIHSIYFGFNRADIRPESTRVLKEIAGILRGHPDWKLQIDGHTDGIGADADNLALSTRRAAAVKTVLVQSYGIDAGRLATAGYGESQPRDTNDTAKGRSHNRRVELRRL